MNKKSKGCRKPNHLILFKVIYPQAAAVYVEEGWGAVCESRGCESALHQGSLDHQKSRMLQFSDRWLTEKHQQEASHQAERYIAQRKILTPSSLWTGMKKTRLHLTVGIRTCRSERHISNRRESFVKPHRFF